LSSLLYFLLCPPPPPSTLFPYTTLFRSFTSSSVVTAPSLNTRVSGLALASLMARLLLLRRTFISGVACASQFVIGRRVRIRCFLDRKSTRLNSSHVKISYAVFCLKKKNK